MNSVTALAFLAKLPKQQKSPHPNRGPLSPNPLVVTVNVKKSEFALTKAVSNKVLITVPRLGPVKTKFSGIVVQKTKLSATLKQLFVSESRRVQWVSVLLRLLKIWPNITVVSVLH